MTVPYHPEAHPAGGKTLILARFHDGSAKNNWGGRATSLALAGVLARRVDVSGVRALNGSFITEPFGDFTVADKLAVRARHVMRRTRRTPMETRPFDEVEDWARRLLRSRRRSERLTSILEIVDAGDELWMNGEGDFILNYSGTLWRTLIIMHLAHLRGRSISLVNSILSESPGRKPVQPVARAVGRVLELCDRVVWRDPESARLATELYPGIETSWAPDALFGWAGPHRSRPYSNETERLPLTVQELLAQQAPLITISGSSTARGFDRARAANLRRLVDSLRAADYAVVIAATSDEDGWMSAVAADAATPFVPANVPLAAGMSLLASSSALISGRYHPTILAACVGTGQIMLGSNSHKSRSLLEILGETDCPVFDVFDSDPVTSGLSAAVVEVASQGPATRQARLEYAASLARRVSTGLGAAR